MRAAPAALRVAIVGSGPAGLYAAVELLRRDSRLQINMFDRLPCLGGLIRYGVAPDHAQRRRVAACYERLALSSGRFAFHGNVEIGGALNTDELAQHHHAVIYASGASGDRRLHIAGEDLPGSRAASEFVGWYNGHPDHATHQFNLQGPRAIVIGNGNVALDLARILLLPCSQLHRTDIAPHALAALARSSVREVVILGRRSPAQAAFTTPELLELASLPGIDVIVEGAVFDETSAEQTLRLKLLQELAVRKLQGHAKRLILRFRCSPLEIVGDDRVTGLRVCRNTLAQQADGRVVARPTDQIESLDCSLVLRAIGYLARPIPGLPFDPQQGIVPNRRGRILTQEGDRALPGHYVTGWLKRGPSGVIGSNKPCSAQTVDCLLEDAAQQSLIEPRHAADHLEMLLRRRQPLRVDHRAWKRLDSYELQQGIAQNRPRIRLCGVDEMLAAAGLFPPLNTH